MNDANDRKESGLEDLVEGEVYQACFKRLSDFEDKDGAYNPIVRISDPLNIGVSHEAEVIFSTNSRWGDQANEIRKTLLEEGEMAARCNVKIIGKSHHAPRTYVAVGWDREPTPNKDKYDMTDEEAFAVLKGGRIFYARYIFRGGDYNDPALRVYEYNKGIVTQGFGFLSPTKPKLGSDDEERRYAEYKITLEIICGSEKTKREGLKPGDYLIVRQVGISRASNTRFFEPVINFREIDFALSPEDKSLVTSVEGYEIGNKICNLPITSTIESKKANRGMLGVGHVKRPGGEETRFYYKPVFVMGAAEDAGKYVRKANILNNGKGIILAKKIL